MVKKRPKDSEKNRKEERRIFAFLATFLSIVGFVIALIVKRDDEYVMYYAKHSLVIFIIGAIAGVLQNILMWIPIIGKIIGFALTAIIVILWVFSWIDALSGEKKEIAVVTEWAEKIRL